jgi:hypothetical protein
VIFLIFGNIGTGLIGSSSAPSDPLWSRYTLLVYLNSDIPKDTGCTTFFLPSEDLGVMEATSVKPIQGAVLCFRMSPVTCLSTLSTISIGHQDEY